MADGGEWDVDETLCFRCSSLFEQQKKVMKSQGETIEETLTNWSNFSTWSQSQGLFGAACPNKASAYIKFELICMWTYLRWLHLRTAGGRVNRDGPNLGDDVGDVLV